MEAQMRRFVGLAIIAVLLSSASADSAMAQVLQSSTAHPVYTNSDYLFSVKLPPGLTYDQTAPPNPNHGFGITFSPKEKLWVDASYTDEISLSNHVAQLSQDCKMLDHRQGLWAGHLAVSFYISCPAMAGDPAYHQWIKLAVISLPSHGTICYQVGVRADESEISHKASVMFDKVASGFKLRHR